MGKKTLANYKSNDDKYLNKICRENEMNEKKVISLTEKVWVYEREIKALNNKITKLENKLQLSDYELVLKDEIISLRDSFKLRIEELKAFQAEEYVNYKREILKLEDQLKRFEAVRLYFQMAKKN